MIRSILPLFLLLLLHLGLAAEADAHKPSDSYLTIAQENGRIEGRWDIALRDLDHALGLDGDLDGRLTWGEVRDRHDEIAAYALSRLTLQNRNGACDLLPGAQLIENHSDGAYSVLPFTADCQSDIDRVSVTYRLFFDLDPQHRGLVKFVKDNAQQSVVLSPRSSSFLWGEERADWTVTLRDYLWQGIRHILMGYDHLLFLITLLLPVAFRRQDGAWAPVDGLPAALAPAIKVITAFTLAHSLTLGAGVLGLLHLPSRLVESAIAVSVLVAAANNLWPILSRRLWVAAFAFGLVHGLGFAAVLGALKLETGALVLSLASFNLGVEFGQLAVMAVALPALFWLRRTPLYPRLVLPVGSLAIGVVGAYWLYERALLP